MTKTYENFKELGEAMTNGDGILHLFNCHSDKDPSYKDHCMAWQSGVGDFAEWLDHIGLKVDVTDKKEDFYNFMSEKYNK